MKRLVLIAAAVVLFLAVLPAAVYAQNGCPRLSLILTPKTGPVGTKVAFTGTLEIIRLNYVLLWGSPEGEEIAQGAAEGYKFDGEFTVPEAPYGSYKIHIHGSGFGESCPSPAAFKVTPTLKVNTKSAPPGAEIELHGTGFPAEAEIEITFAGSSSTTADTSPKGTFTVTLPIPITHSGNHVIKATHSNLKSADIPEVSFQVVPVISVSNQAPAIGDEVKLTGHGFAAQSKITIKYDDKLLTPKEENVVTDDNGSFNATIVIPYSPKSTHTLAVVDASGGTASGNMATMLLELEKEPPPKPMPVRPINERFGIYGSKVVAFEWTAVEDPSGVIYNLEIAKDLTFFPPERKKTKLEESAYVLTPAEALPMGTYYWRVQAVDGAGNKSEWSVSPYPIKIGLIPIWGFVIAGFVVLIIGLYILRAIVRFILSFFRY